MVKQRMDLLELLRKRGMARRRGFSAGSTAGTWKRRWTASWTPVVSAQIGDQRLEAARRRQPVAGHLPGRRGTATFPHLGHPGGHHGVAHSQAAGRQLLPVGGLWWNRGVVRSERPLALCLHIQMGPGRCPGQGVQTSTGSSAAGSDAGPEWQGPWGSRQHPAMRTGSPDSRLGGVPRRICDQATSALAQVRLKENFPAGRAPMDDATLARLTVWRWRRRLQTQSEKVGRDGRIVNVCTRGGGERRASMPKGSVRSWVSKADVGTSGGRRLPAGWPSCGR